MSETKNWIDLSQHGFEIAVAEFHASPGSRAVVIRGSRTLTSDQETALRRIGFKSIPGPRTVWARHSDSFSLKEIRSAFPQAAVAAIPAAKTRVTIEGPSPFEPRPQEQAPAAPTAASSPSPAPRPMALPSRMTLPGRPPAPPRPATAVEAPPASAPTSTRPAASASPLSRLPSRPSPLAAKPTAPSAPSVVATEPPEEDDAVFDAETVNAFQARYVPASRVGTPIAMVPLNMASATRAALERIVREHGDLDEWTAGKLGWTVAEMAGFLSPEQVDAVALAIYAAERKRGFILADQTGLGKGRVLAAVARAAVVSGKHVVFLTEKDNLFTDFWRDVTDIGSDDAFGKPLLVNDGSRIVDPTSMDAKVIHEAPRAADLKKIIKSGKLPKGCRLVMATYSQFNRKGSVKSEFLRNLAKDSHFISDESHNAVGDSNTSESIALAVGSAAAVTYSSATFARNAANMAAYAPVFPPSIRAMDIAEVLKLGGQALQEALSQTLAEDGVLVRREHDLSNIRIEVVDDAARIERNKLLADALAPILSRMAGLARQVDALAESRNEENRDALETMPASSRKAAREKWYTVNFGSRLSAVVRQFVTALKVEQCVEKATDALLKGIKPVVVIETTMEALMKELAADDGEYVSAEDYGADEGDADEGGQPQGDVVGRPPDFRDALGLMLDRMTMLSVKRPDADPEKVQVEDPGIVQAAAEIRELIAAFPDLPLSPIDDIRDRIEAEGRRLLAEGRVERVWKADEISARSTRVQDGAYVPMPPRDRNAVIAQFNGGATDILVITKAGSTGLSLHASEKVKDQRKRRMIELQIPSNVVERVQFWGRVNRRGQVCEPDFQTLSTGLPIEVRLLAMQNRKVADLSANVTASSRSASAMDVPDVLDSVGNQVAKRILDDSPALAEQMCIAMRVDPDKAEEELYFVNKLLSRLVLLPSELQENVYATAVSAYEDALRELAARGRHPHKARELDGSWRMVGREVFEPGNPVDGPVFGRPVYMSTIEARHTLAPLGDADVRSLVVQSRERIAATAGRSDALFAADVARIRARREEILSGAMNKKFSSVRQALAAAGTNAVKTANERLNALCEALSHLQPGITMMVPNDDGEAVTAVVTDVRAPDEASAHLPGKWIVRYVIVGDESQREVSAATIIKDTRIILHAQRQGEALRIAYPQFDRAARGEVTVTRKVLDGNLVTAVKASREGGYGTAVTYTDEQGRRRRGVLIPKARQNALHTLPAKTQSPEAAFEIVRRGGSVHTNPDRPSEGAIIRSEAGMAVIEIPGKKRAAKPYETPDLIRIAGEFTGDWRFRAARVPPERLLEALRALAAAGHQFHFDGRHRQTAAAAAVRETKDSQEASAPNP